jgi:hypothetical protein
MVIIANQHGNEFTVSNSALEIIRALTSNASGAKAIRDELTVTVIPRVNVDGFDATPTGSPWRQNVDPFCSANCPAFYEEDRGYDINRYHSYPPGISRNAYGLLGSASVLIEMRGDIGQKSNGYIAKTAYIASASVVDALADGSLYETSTARAEALKERGPSVDNDE